MRRYVDLSEKVTATFYDEQYEEWTQQTVTIADVLDSVCDDYTVLSSAQPTQTNTSNALKSLDCVDRQAAIQALDNAAEQWNIAEPYHEGMRAGFRNSARLILSLPSAEPTQTNTSNTLKSLDCISRQAAIDLWDKYHPYISIKAMAYDRELRALPSVHPEEIALHESCTDCPLYDKDRHSCRDLIK